MFAVAITLGLLLVLDVVMLQYLESRGAAQLAQTMSAEDAEVDLGGFPFLPRFLSGSLTGVSAHVNGASGSGGLRVGSVDARAEEISFSAGEIFALARSSFATRTTVTSKTPIVMIELSEGDINDFVRRAIPAIGDVQIKASGIEVRFLIEGVDPGEGRPNDEDLTKPARYLPGTRDRRLHLILTGVAQIPNQYRFEAGRLEELIELPQFPEGLEPDVSLREGILVIEAQGAEASIDVGEGAQ